MDGSEGADRPRGLARRRALLGFEHYSGPGAGTDGERFGLLALFAVVFGGIWLVHGVLLFGLPRFAFGTDPAVGVAGSTVAVAVGGAALGQAVAFFGSYLPREREVVAPLGSTFEPFPRMLVLHYATLVGGFAIALYGMVGVGLVLLVVLKTAADLVVEASTARTL